MDFFTLMAQFIISFSLDFFVTHSVNSKIRRPVRSCLEFFKYVTLVSISQNEPIQYINFYTKNMCICFCQLFHFFHKYLSTLLSVFPFVMFIGTSAFAKRFHSVRCFFLLLCFAVHFSKFYTHIYVFSNRYSVFATSFASELVPWVSYLEHEIQNGFLYSLQVATQISMFNFINLPPAQNYGLMLFFCFVLNK